MVDDLKPDKIKLKALIATREQLIKDIVTEEINEAFFRRQVILSNTPENEQSLAASTNTLIRYQGVLDVVETKIKEIDNTIL